MSVESVGSNRAAAAYEQTNTVQVSGKYSTHKLAISSKVKYAVLGLFALYAATNVPGAEAGFGFFTACMAACTSATMGFGVMACAAACSATLAAPTP